MRVLISVANDYIVLGYVNDAIVMSELRIRNNPVFNHLYNGT